MKTFLRLALLAVAVVSLASCRQKVIEGKVTDEQGNAIAGALVRIDNSPFEARTGMKGEYRLDYTPGEVKLVTSMEGYETQEVVLSVPEKGHYIAPPARLRREDDPIPQQQAEKTQEAVPSVPEKWRRYAALPSQLRRDDNATHQKETASDIRNLGAAMFGWLTDQVGAAAAGQQVSYVDIRQSYVPISHAQLSELLVPQYIRSVPETDGWGHKLDFYLDVKNPLAQKVMAVRSPGRDGIFSSGPYPIKDFAPEDYDEDIVWADGFFVRWPEGRTTR